MPAFNSPTLQKSLICYSNVILVIDVQHVCLTVSGQYKAKQSDISIYTYS